MWNVIANYQRAFQNRNDEELDEEDYYNAKPFDLYRKDKALAWLYWALRLKLPKKVVLWIMVPLCRCSIGNNGRIVPITRAILAPSDHDGEVWENDFGFYVIAYGVYQCECPKLPKYIPRHQRIVKRSIFSKPFPTKYEIKSGSKSQSLAKEICYNYLFLYWCVRKYLPKDVAKYTFDIKCDDCVSYSRGSIFLSAITNGEDYRDVIYETRGCTCP